MFTVWQLYYRRINYKRPYYFLLILAMAPQLKNKEKILACEVTFLAVVKSHCLGWRLGACWSVVSELLLFSEKILIFFWKIFGHFLALFCSYLIFSNDVFLVFWLLYIVGVYVCLCSVLYIFECAPPHKRIPPNKKKNIKKSTRRKGATVLACCCAQQ